MSQPLNMPIPYVDTQDLIKQMNLQQSSIDPTKYIIWQIPTSVDIINQFVSQANVQATALYGNLTQTPKYGLVKQWAINKAFLNLIEEMTVNWVVSGLPVTVGDISINRLQAMAAASVELKERLQSELHKLYIWITEFDFPQNYQPTSPYILTGGSTFWS
jgi:hypothetical protein